MSRLTILAVLIAVPAVMCGDKFDAVMKYEAFRDATSASDAAAKCAASGGKLADLGSVALLNAVRASINDYPRTPTEFWVAGKTSLDHHAMVSDADLGGSGDRCRIVSNYVGSPEVWNIYAKNCGESRGYLCEY